MISSAGLFPLKLYFMMNLSCWTVQHLALGIIIALSKQNTSPALYFKNSFIGWQSHILLWYNLLLHHNGKSSGWNNFTQAFFSAV